jgi:hypothetical protein
MIDTPTYGSTPGIGTIIQTTERVVWWGRDENLIQVDNRLIDSTAVDAGNSPTTELRAGLLLGEQTSDGNLYQWNPDAVDGTEVVAAVLLRDISMLGSDGTVEDKIGHLLVGGPVKVGDLFIEGTAFSGDADEHAARVQMGPRFLFDDDYAGGPGFLGQALVWKNITAATLTPTAAQNGFGFVMSNAASTTVTLPTIGAGLAYQFLRTGDEEFVVNSAAGDDMIVGNDLSADGITFTTAGEHMGVIVRVESLYVGTTLKWLLTLPQSPLTGQTTIGNTMTFAVAT